MKIGILGGTFNPPHNGHLVLAQNMLDALKLDKIFFVPTNTPPHKNTFLIQASHRFNMVKLAIEDNSLFEVLDWEIKRGGPSYTIDTIKELKAKFPKDELFLVIGSDLANDFHTWKEYKVIKRLVKVAVAKRDSFPLKKEVDFFTVDIAQIEVTSSLVREHIQKGLSIKNLMPQKVFAYIQENKLYK